MMKILKNILIVVVSICLLFAIACSNQEIDTTPNLNIVEESVQIYIGQSIKLNIEKDNLNGDITFSVDQPSVATISTDGMVTGLSEGSTIITVSVGDLKDACRVIVLKQGASSEEFPFITVANEQVSVNVGGVYFVYPKLFVGTQQVTSVNFNVSVENQNVISATCENDMVKIIPIAVGTSKLIISTTQADKIIEKVIFITVLEQVGSETVTGFITQSGVCQVNINGITGKTADVYIADFVIAGVVYPNSISFTLTESQMSILDDKNIGDEISISIFGDNGKAYSTKIAVFGSEKYDKKVYIQENGEIKGLDGFDSITFAGNNFEIYNVSGITYISGDEWTAIKNSLYFGDTVVGSVLQENKVIEIEMKYVTIAISNYKELESIENGAANYYVLTNDIDCEGKNWQPKNNTTFVSVFDGNGYAIRNLTLSNMSSEQYNGYSDNTFVGVNGWQCKFITILGESAVIKNVVFDGLKSYGDITKTALFGRNNGLIENVVMSVAAPTMDGFAGLVGENNGTIKDCVLDYTVQDQWVMGYIATTNSGTIENVIVNIPENFVQHNFKLIGTDNKTSTGCEQVVKSKSEMISYITNSTLKELYKKISINALSIGAKTKIDFNGTTVNGYTVSLAKNTTFEVTNDYIADLKARNIVGVKIWINGSAYVDMEVKSSYTLVGNYPNQSVWQCEPNIWTPFNYGRHYCKANDFRVEEWFADTILLPDELASFKIKNTGHNGSIEVGTVEFKVYIEEYTELTIPVVSGKEYTSRIENIAGNEVNVYRVEFTSRNNSTYADNAISGFMFSEGYLNNLAKEGYSSITIMIKTDGLIQTALGYAKETIGWQADWRNSSILSDWTALNHAVTNAPYTIEQAKDLHIQGLTGNGLSYPTYVEFYIVANK